MRIRTVLVVLTLALAARCQPPHGLVEAAGPLATATTLLGAWNGEWATATETPANGVVELVLARVPGRDTVLGQFTFVMDGTSRTLRYEGRLENGTVRFPLVGEGRIVLEAREAARPGTAPTLQGEWVDARGALPAPRGTLRLERVAVR